MKKFLPILILLFCCASACAEQEAPTPVPVAEAAPAPAEALAQISEVPAALHDAMSELTNYAKSLIAIPYKYGGTTPESGFDCSGFVRHVFQKSVGWLLPHNSREISHTGESLQSDQLSPGDLVFYNTRHKPFSHVGIYIGENQFIHSPSRGRAIEVVSMRDKYWRKRYNGARRIPLQS